MKQQTLKYGQIIRIHLSENKINGVIIGKGFLDPYVYLMQTDDLSLINNFRDTLFIILPRGTFELHDEYLKKRKEYIEDSLESRKQTEEIQYNSIIQSRMNEEILLGAEVIFKHIDSQQYLYGSYECSDIAMDAFKLKLSTHLSSQAIFKLSIYHTYQKDGQLIYIDEPITIMHEKSKCKLDYEDGQIFLDSFDSNREYQINPERYSPKIKKPLNQRKEAVISLNSQTQWKFQTLENQNIFTPHDLCFFISTQNRGYLSYEQQKLTLKEYKDNEYIPLNAVWELEQYENKFIIRNIFNGNVINSDAELINFDQQINNNNIYFQIETAKYGNIEQLQFNSLVKIRFENLELQKQQKDIQYHMKKLSSITPQIDNYYQQLSIDDLEYIQYNVQFQNIKSMHGFQIKKLKDKFKQDLLFIISSHELLQQFCDLLRFGSKIIEEKLTDKILTQVLKVLKKLIAYLLNCQHYQIDQCENIPISQRQYFMKDLMIVELIMQIIYYLWKIDSKNLFNQRKYERDKLGQIYLYSYRLIEKMSKKNQIVKLYISQWLRFLLIQVIEINDEQISKSIFELLDDNYYSITKFINKEALQKLVSDISATQQLKEIYLRIFSSIIICKGKPIVDNQMTILELIQSTQQIYEKNGKQYKQPGLFYLIKMKLENQKAYILWKQDQWYTLKEFYLESKIDDNSQTWNYFLAYINLLSDICTNRNSFGQEYVQKNYDLSILCNIIWDEETQEINAIDPFLKLIHSAFIDCKTFSPIRRIARVREWAIIQNKNDIIKTKTILSTNLLGIMQFIHKFINLKEVIKNDKINYETLYTVLQVLKTTIRLGFWQSISDLQDLFKPLFNIVEFTQQEQELNENNNLINQQQKNRNQKLQIQENNENNFVFQCKQLSCEIIDIIIDMETNVRVSLSTAYLKTLIEEYEKLNQQDDINLCMKDTIQLYQERKIKYVQQIQLWRDKFQKLIEERNLFQKDEELSKFKVQKIIELIYFDNQVLQNYSIKLLNRVFGQRKELIENFEKTIIEYKGFMHTLCQDSRITRNKLLRFNDKNILMAQLENQDLYNVIFWGESQDVKQSGVIQDLYWLVECLKQGDKVKRENIQYDEIFPKNKLQQTYTEKERNFKLYQSLIKYQDLHENIVEFLELAIESIKQDQKNELIMKTLYACFRFLTMLIWNHQENKKDFSKILDQIYPYIKLNVFCVQFLRELFQNNKQLLFNESKCQKIVMEIVEQCELLPFNNFYKSQLLDFLRVLTIYNQKSIKVNQNIIMAALQNRKFNKIMILFNSEIEENSILNELYTQINQYHKQYRQLFSQVDNNNEQYIILSPEITYLFNFYQLLTMLIQDRNEINIGKCLQMHPYSKLIIQYQNLGQCWPLKRHLRGYINRLYYKHTKQFIGITQKIIEVDLENILQDLKDIVELKESELAYQKIRIKNPSRYSYLCSYYYLTLEENLISLNLIFEQNSFFDDLEDTLRENIQKKKYKLHFDLLQLGTLLKKIQNNWSTSEFIFQFINNLMIILCTIYKTFNLQTIIVREISRFEDIQIKKQINQKKYQNGKILLEKNKSTEISVELIKYVQNQIEDLANRKNNTNLDQLKDDLIDKLYDLTNIKKSIKENFSFKKQKKRKNKFSQETQENEELNNQHKLLMKQLNKSPIIAKFLDDEFYNFCDKLMELNQTHQFDQEINKKQIYLQQVLKNVIQLNLTHYDILNEELKIFILRILERTITSQVPQNQNERQKQIEEWEPDDWSQYKQKIEKQQLFLLNCGAAELICKFLQVPNLEQRLALTNQLISFGIAFLLGGNTDCQNAILEKLQNDNLNLILINYKQLIIRVSRAVYNNFKFRKYKINGDIHFQVNLHDNYDYYDENKGIMKRKYVIEEDDDKEIRIKEQFIILFIRSFRFMQLLCENNNKNMKNFIRQQIDIDTCQKIGSINYIELATSQLRIFLKTFNKNILQVPIFILEFILEVVQVPCLENQLTLCKTTFFEDVCYFILQMSNDDMIFQRKLNEEQSRDMLYQIYNKIMIIIISVLEGNDDRILHDLQKKIDPKMLIQVIKEFLKSPKLQVEDVQEMEQKLNQNKDFQYINEIKQILNVIIIKEKIQFEKFNLEKENDNIKGIIELLQSKILRIEIVYQNKEQTIFFPSHPLFQFLSDETRDMIMYRINRDTYREKILGLLEFKDLIHKELEYSYKLSKLEQIPVTQKTIQTLRRLSAFFSILVNILMILSYNMEIYNYQVQLIADYYEQLIINILSLSQLFTTIIYYIFYLRYRIPLFIQPYEDFEQILYQQQQQQQQKQINEQNEQNNNQIIGKRSYSITGIDEKILKNAQQQLFNQKKLYSQIGIFLLEKYRKFAQQIEIIKPKFEKYYYILLYILEQIKNIRKFEENILSTTFYLIFSLLGTFYKSYFFSLHLFDLFSRLTLLNNVFQAISHNASQLIVVSLLGVLFIFVFSFTSFDQYADDIYTEKQPEEHCETLISCMITLVTSGVIGTSMSKWDFVKFCYDTLYFVFFALLFTNIVSGIMIDTFAELRDQRQKIDDDKNNCCFICGAKRAELEKNCQQFDKHIKDQHFLWNYIYYIYCLNNTNFTEYTGLEYSIKDMIKAENISWFPMQIEDEQNQDNKIDDKIQQIETQIQDKLNKINNLIQVKLEKDIPQKIDHINLILTQMQLSYKSN